MAFRKFRASQLFDGYQFRDEQPVLITSGLGVVEAIVPAMEAGDDVEQLEGILCPGMVNCHCHLELSHMKGLVPRQSGMVPFVSKVMMSRDAAQEVIWEKMAEALTQMTLEGIVAIGDICNTSVTASQKKGAGIRFHHFIEVSGLDPEQAGQRFEKAVDVFNSLSRNSGNDLINCSIVPHSPYSVSGKLWEKIMEFPGNQLLCMHNQESEDESRLFQHKQGKFLDLFNTLHVDASVLNLSGKSSFQTCLPNFQTGQTVIMVHNVHTSAEDLDYYLYLPRKPEIHWCFCPSSNLYITGQLPDVSLFTKRNLPIALGTDSLASNDQLSLVNEMKILRQNFPFLKLDELLRWATLNGARALHLENILGSFEKGKKPGIVLCDTDLQTARRII